MRAPEAALPRSAGRPGLVFGSMADGAAVSTGSGAGTAEKRRPAWAARWSPHAQRVLPGAYAWIATVAGPAASREASAVARGLALAALIALLAGPFVGLERPRTGRWVGVGVFVTLSVGAWLALGPLVSVARIDPVRAALGGVGWACFALAWGNPRRMDRVPEDDPRAIVGDALAARGSLPAGATAILVVGVAGALLPLLVAWRVDRGGHALLAHAVALLCSFYVLHVATEVALERGERGPAPNPAARVHSARHALGAAAVLAALGALALFAR